MNVGAAGTVLALVTLDPTPLTLLLGGVPTFVPALGVRDAALAALRVALGAVDVADVPGGRAALIALALGSAALDAVGSGAELEPSEAAVPVTLVLGAPLLADPLERSDVAPAGPGSALLHEMSASPALSRGETRRESDFMVFAAGPMLEEHPTSRGLWVLDLLAAENVATRAVERGAVGRDAPDVAW